MLDRAGIAACLPHAGRMCLLEEVICWDESGIRCRAVSHRDADNPLREAGGLAALAVIEYAAQAAAVHGALLHGRAVARGGVLASLKNVATARPWLHDLDEDLVIEATLLHRDPAGGIFDFNACAGATPVLSGQFTLMYIDTLREPA